ncbi:MAG: protein kinase [Planctomycetota bacterium]
MLAELYVLNGRDVGKVLDASAGPVIFLGRAATNTLRIRDPQASRVHCRIDVTTDGLTLSDAKSGNGTFVNGERVEGKHALSDGDLIGVGGTRIKVLIETEVDQEAWEARRGRMVDASAPLETSGSESLTRSSSEAVPARPAPARPAAQEASGSGEGLRAEVSGDELPAPEREGEGRLREVIAGYRLEARLGGHSRNGIAVYRATQNSLERTVALKVFLPRGQTSQRDVDRFLREAKAVGRLPHPNIVTIHDVISQQKLRAIVMEFLAGGSLADQLDTGPLDLKGVARVALAISSALAYLHSHGVVHRGVKPSNLLLAREHRTYKLGNFASATGLQGQRHGDTSFMDAPLEGFAFLAPEQLGADPGRTGPPADVYGLGACLLAATLGAAPFEGSSVPALAARILRDPPPEPPGWVPPPLRAVIARCLAKEPEARFAQGAELLRALQAIRA